MFCNTASSLQVFIKLVEHIVKITKYSPETERSILWSDENCTKYSSERSILWSDESCTKYSPERKGLFCDLMKNPKIQNCIRTVYFLQETELQIWTDSPVNIG